MLNSHNKQFDIIANDKEALFPNFFPVFIISQNIHIFPKLLKILFLIHFMRIRLRAGFLKKGGNLAKQTPALRVCHFLGGGFFRALDNLFIIQVGLKFARVLSLFLSDRLGRVFAEFAVFLCLLHGGFKGFLLVFVGHFFFKLLVKLLYFFFFFYYYLEFIIFFFF